MSDLGVCWIGGGIVPVDQARVSVLDHGLLYGDGVFEGIRFYSGRPLLLQAHLKRLSDSARAIALSLPCGPAELASIVQQVVDAFGRPDGYVRLVVTRGKGPLGINPATCPESGLFVIADELQWVDDEVRRTGLRTIVASIRRLPLDGLDPRIKSLNYLNHVLARIEANRAGVEEAFLLNPQGSLTEGTADNVFIVRDNELLTPPCSDGALPGITRALVMRLGRDDGATVREASLGAYDLYTADECFLTGTGAELLPVREVDGRSVRSCPGPLFERLERRFRDYVRAKAR